MREIAHNWISSVRIKVNASRIAAATASAAQSEDRSANQKTTFFDSIGQTETNDHVSGTSALDRTPEESANCRPGGLAPGAGISVPEKRPFSSRSRRRCYSSRYFFLGGVAIFMSEGADSATFGFSFFSFLASRLLRT